MRRKRWRVALGVVAMLAFGVSVGGAEVVTEQSASILVFPKVIADGTRDTIIQITNTSNSVVYAHCFYMNADYQAGQPQCIEVDFDITLTRQQPTYWRVSEGRLANPFDPPCSRLNEGPLSCLNSGIDPGRVPPVVDYFQGELKCIEVDASGAPLSGNHLKGEATLVTYDVCNPNTGTCELSGEGCDPEEPGEASDCDPEQFDVAKYNALGILGNEQNNRDGILCLGGEPSDACPNGAEYNACPQTWILNHMAEGAANPVVGELGDPNSSVSTDITVVPCSENFETQVPASLTLQFAITNEYEQTFSASTTVRCWAEMNLASINEVFLRSSLGTDFVQTRIRPSNLTSSGFMVVSDERHVSGPLGTGTAASNLHVEGERTVSDLIVIPGEQIVIPDEQ